MIDLRQSLNYAHYLKLVGWQTEKINHCYAYIRRIPLTPFSIMKIQRPVIISLNNIGPIAKKHHSFIIYIEPATIKQAKSLINQGFKKNNSPFLPTKSLELNLLLSEVVLFNQMKKDARHHLREAKKKSLQLIEVSDLPAFRQVWSKSVSWKRWIPSLASLEALKKAFGKKALFLTTGKPIVAGTIVLVANQKAYYYQAFTSKRGRIISAQYFLVWETIKKVKRMGCKIFDFEGIFDDRFPQNSWKGFTHFKKSFGGKEKEYPGPLLKWRWPLS